MEYVSQGELVRRVEGLDGAIHAQGCQMNARIDVLASDVRAELGELGSRMSTGFDVVDMRFKMVDMRFDSLEKQFQSGKRMMGLVATLLATWFTAMSVGVAWLQLDPTGSVARFRQQQKSIPQWSVATPQSAAQTRS